MPAQAGGTPLAGSALGIGSGVENSNALKGQNRSWSRILFRPSRAGRILIRIGSFLFRPLRGGGKSATSKLAKGGQGGVGPARPVTRSSHALSLSVLSHPSREARRIVLDFQGSRITPPAPPSQGGERDRSRRHSIPRNRNTCLEIAPPALSTLTFHRPSRPLLCLTHFDHGVIECSIEDRRLRHAVYRPDEPGEFGRSTENRNSSRIPPSENPQQRRHPECDRRRPGREPRAHP